LHLETQFCAILLTDVDNDSLLVLQLEAGFFDEEADVIEAVSLVLATVAVEVAVANEL
jgi:hypothetical protein